MTVKLVDFYKADGLGWFLGVFKTTCGKNGDPILPTTGTTNKPALKDGYWYKLNFSSKKWSAVKQPTTCAEAVEAGLSCVANSPNQHEQEVKALLENLVKAESDKYKTVIGDGMVMTIEAIPEPTEEEKEIEEKKAAQEEREETIRAVKSDMITAIANNDTDWLEELRTEYAELMAETEE